MAVAVGAGLVAGTALWLTWRSRAVGEVRPVAVAVPAPGPAAPAPGPAAAAPAPAATLPALPATLLPLLPPPVEKRAHANEPAPPSPRTEAAPPEAAGDPAAGLQLQAISEHEGQPVAVLSNRVVHEGDHFDGVTIVRIGVDEVEIEVRGTRRTLRF
jgi:hypothetical protein